MIESELQQLSDIGQLRRLSKSTGIDFSSNDYLGFKNHPDIRRQLMTALESGIDLGSTGSRLIRGNHSLFEEMENFLAEKYETEAALIFNCGYSANTGVLTALGESDPVIYSDSENHASLIDGIRLSKAEYHVYPHNNLDALEDLIKATSNKSRIVVTESVFSMSGDLAPLEDLLDLCKRYECLLILDEAHATGIFGSGGLGRIQDLKKSNVEILSIHTCGKAIGSFGAFMTCTNKIKTYIINKARTFIFTTALPPLVMVQWKAAFNLLQKEPWRRSHVHGLVQQFKELYRPSLNPSNYISQIVPVILGSNEKVQAGAIRLQEEGFDIRGIRYPTVAKGSERLRITLTAERNANEILHLCQTLMEITHV